MGGSSKFFNSNVLLYRMTNNTLELKNFLKKFTSINNNFIDEYYKFYELCDNEEFGIDLDIVIEYLYIKKKKILWKDF